MGKIFAKMHSPKSSKWARPAGMQMKRSISYPCPYEIQTAFQHFFLRGSRSRRMHKKLGSLTF